MTENKENPVIVKNDSSNIIDDIFYTFSNPQKVIGGLKDLVSETLSKIPFEKRTKPHRIVSNKIIQGLFSSQDEPTIRQLYINLLSASMDADRIEFAHPAYAEIVNQICPDEAKFLKNLYMTRKHEFPMISIRQLWPKQPNGQQPFETVLNRFSQACVNCGMQFPYLYSRYRDNLKRLGMIVVDDDNYFQDQNRYEATLLDPIVSKTIQQIKDRGLDHEVKKGIIGLSDFGKAFAFACIGEMNG